MANARARTTWIGHVVSHTHWDRAWYLPAEGYRPHLIRTVLQVVAALESDPGFRYFLLDGQSVVLEDVVEVLPELRPRLEALVRRGRLLVGPFYTMPDEFLVAGESLVRNLAIGVAVAEGFGRSMKVGYLPDTFGHVAQLPQILRGFGIGSFVFTRGLGDEAETVGTEFWWEAPDGSRVLAVYQADGYGNLALLGIPSGRRPGETSADPELAVSQLRATVERLLRQGPSTQHLLLGHGGDHLPLQPGVSGLLETLNRRGLPEGVELVHSNLPAYVEAVEKELAGRPSKLPILSGELHGSRRVPVLSGVFSSRIYLKQMNHQAETLLVHLAEPLAAWALVFGGEDLRPLLRFAWKELLKCHPHDDICGCGVDAIHRDAEARFARVVRLGEAVVSEAFWSRAVPKLGEITVFNPGPRPGMAPVVAEVWLPQGEGTAGSLAVEDGSGRRWAAVRLAAREAAGWLGGWERGEPAEVDPAEDRNVPWRPDVLGPAGAGVGLSWQGRWKPEGVERAFIAFVPELPAVGFRAFRVIPGSDKGWSTFQLLRAGGDGEAVFAENRWYRVQFVDGALQVLHRPSGRLLPRTHLWEDQADAGDTYNFSPLPGDRPVIVDPVVVRAEVAEAGPVRAVLQIEGEMRLPAALDRSRGRRSTEQVTLPFRTRVVLWADVDRIDFETVLTQRARDHRLRVLFVSDIPRREVRHVWADSKFAVVQRPVEPQRGEGWVELPATTQASDRFIALERGTGDRMAGLAVFHAGTPEYEVTEVDGQAAIALTLVRAVGWLSRPDLSTRRDNAGPQVPTPDAQCLRTLRYRYALVAYEGDWATAQLPAKAAEFVALPRAFPARLDIALASQASDCGISLVTVESRPTGALVLSAVKPWMAEREPSGFRGLVVRLYNPSPVEATGLVRLGVACRRIWATDLAENPGREVPAKRVAPSGTEFEVRLRPGQIGTWAAEAD